MPDEPMGPAEFDEIADRWGWSRRHLAKVFGTGSTTVDNWATGRVSIPPRVAEWMRLVDKLLKAVPAPQREDWHRLLPTKGGGGRKAEPTAAAA